MTTHLYSNKKKENSQELSMNSMARERKQKIKPYENKRLNRLKIEEKQKLSHIIINFDSKEWCV